MSVTFFKKAFSEDGSRRSYYILFTLVFCILSAAGFFWFILYGSSLIGSSDAWSLHFRALVYYSKYLKEIFGRLFTAHKLVIPEWDFYIGEGSDILNSLNHYVAGDPVAFLSVLVPAQYMQYFFGFSSIVKLYLAGLSFCMLCFGTGQKNRYGIMAGAIGYSFCGLALQSAVQYPEVLIPMICLPLMILGMEKIIRGERIYLLIIVTAVFAAGNLSFFLAGICFFVIYALIRLGFLYGKQAQEGIAVFLKIILSLAVGMCMAGIWLLPVFMMSAAEHGITLSGAFFRLYPRIWYSALPGAVISDGAPLYPVHLMMGYTPLVIPAAVLLFMKKKKDTFLKVLSGICLAAAVFPAAGRFLADKTLLLPCHWSWAAALLGMYILVREWDDLVSPSGKQWLAMFGLCAAFFVLCFICSYSRTKTAEAAFPLLFFSLLIVEKGNINRILWRQRLLWGIALLQALLCAFWVYAPGTGNVVINAKQSSRVWDEWNNNEAAAVRSLADESEYVRMTGRYLTPNANVFEGISSTQYNWASSGPAMNDFRSSLEMREPLYQNYMDYDDRTTPTALSAAGYYSTRYSDSKGMPYGYTLLEKIDGDTRTEEKLEQLKQELGVNELSQEQENVITYKTTSDYIIYKNDYALPPGYCYDAYIPKETWNTLDPVQKQEAQLLAACVDEAPEGIEAEEPAMPDYVVSYSLECQGAEISQGPGSFITTTADTQAVLTLQQEIPNAETYVEFTGLEFAATPEYDLYLGKQSVDPSSLYNRTNWDMLPKDTQITIRKDKTYWNPAQDVSIAIEPSAGKKKNLEYIQPESPLSGGRHDFIVNLGYTQEAVTAITLTFPAAGVYSFDSLKVYEVPMDGFDAKIAKLQANTLQDTVFGTDTVTGCITLNREKLLCLAVPYSRGWEALIDGRKTKVTRVNERYQGIAVPAGEHTVEFRYHTPFRKTGSLLSLLGLAGFITVIVLDIKKKQKSSGEETDR